MENQDRIKVFTFHTNKNKKIRKKNPIKPNTRLEKFRFPESLFEEKNILNFNRH